MKRLRTGILRRSESEQPVRSRRTRW